MLVVAAAYFVGFWSHGGQTLPMKTWHIRLVREDGSKIGIARVVIRTRENLCAPSQTDIQRQEHQQALFNALKSRLFSFSSFLRLPWIAWHAPPAIISDMGGPTLLGLFAGMAASGTPPARVLKPSGVVTLPDGEQGLTVSEAERKAAVARFMNG